MSAKNGTEPLFYGGFTLDNLRDIYLTLEQAPLRSRERGRLRTQVAARYGRSASSIGSLVSVLKALTAGDPDHWVQSTHSTLVNLNRAELDYIIGLRKTRPLPEKLVEPETDPDAEPLTNFEPEEHSDLLAIHSTLLRIEGLLTRLVSLWETEQVLG